MTRRLKVLVFLVVLLLVGVGVALWPQRRAEPVTILGPWTDDQGEQFERVLRGLGVPFEYQGTAAQREVLLSKVQSGDPPDIAIMPGLGELAEYAGQHRLKPLDKLYTDKEYDAPWRLVSGARGQVYWVPVKVDLKSIVWYRRGAAPVNSPSLDNWCIGMGDDGTSGWPGSDWIEDLVLQRSGPGAYGRWALGEPGGEWTGAAVRDAWEAWAGLLRQNRTAARHALLTDHRGESGPKGLLFEGWGGCSLEHQGSFARFFYSKPDLKRTELTDSAPLLPLGPYRVRGHEVTGDFAALFRDRPQARELLQRLASRKGQQAWADTGVFSANRGVRPKAGPFTGEIARRLTGDGPRCLDASDVMPPAVRDAFYEAVLLTIARIAEGKKLDVRGLLGDVQRVATAHPPGAAAPRAVCSAD